MWFKKERKMLIDKPNSVSKSNKVIIKLSAATIELEYDSVEMFIKATKFECNLIRVHPNYNKYSSTYNYDIPKIWWNKHLYKIYEEEMMAAYGIWKNNGELPENKIIADKATHKFQWILRLSELSKGTEGSLLNWFKNYTESSSNPFQYLKDSLMALDEVFIDTIRYGLELQSEFLNVFNNQPTESFDNWQPEFKLSEKEFKEIAETLFGTRINTNTPYSN